MYGDTVEIGNFHHENGPGEFWRTEFARSLEKLESLKTIHRSARIYDPSVDVRQVELGTRVRVREVARDRDEKVDYTVVAANDILVCARLWIDRPGSWVSSATPKGKGLLGKELGQKDILVTTPGGEERLEITELLLGDFTLKLPGSLSKTTVEG